MTIPFNKPYLSGKEIEYIRDAVVAGKISGDGKYTEKCHLFFQDRYNFKKCLLTTSCTDALEMAAILLNIQPGDEIIAPNYTFVSTVNAFVLRGAQIVFCDSRTDHPGLNEDLIEKLITPKTKVIIPVHYAGVACDMEKIMIIAQKHKLFVVEDAAQAIDSYYTFLDGTKKPLGGIGHMGVLSFHETKNIISGEGGMLVINDEQFVERAEIIREKGTNRSKFFRGEVDKYGWVDLGSSFLPSDIIAAFLYAQLEKIDEIQTRRRSLWDRYNQNFKKYSSDIFQLPIIPKYSSNNAHMYYIVFKNEKNRRIAINKLKTKNILSVFHYQSLNKSKYHIEHNTTIINLPFSDRYSECLLRLPFYYELEFNQIDKICDYLMDII
jgi:dTDP-4-amino-4,6-dideoxygalactose transaminase